MASICRSAIERRGHPRHAINETATYRSSSLPALWSCRSRRPAWGYLPSWLLIFGTISNKSDTGAVAENAAAGRLDSFDSTCNNYLCSKMTRHLLLIRGQLQRQSPRFEHSISFEYFLSSLWQVGHNSHFPQRLQTIWLIPTVLLISNKELPTS